MLGIRPLFLRQLILSENKNNKIITLKIKELGMRLTGRKSLAAFSNYLRFEMEINNQTKTGIWEINALGRHLCSHGGICMRLTTNKS